VRGSGTRTTAVMSDGDRATARCDLGQHASTIDTRDRVAYGKVRSEV